MGKISEQPFTDNIDYTTYLLGIQGGVTKRISASSFTTTLWHTGAGVPSISIGTTDDLYLDTETSNIYKKENNSWGAPILNIKGADGALWHLGSGAPASGLGVNGDYYLDSDSFNIYTKGSGTWTLIGCIKGQDGTGGGGGGDFLVMQVFS